MAKVSKLHRFQMLLHAPKTRKGDFGHSAAARDAESIWGLQFVKLRIICQSNFKIKKLDNKKSNHCTSEVLDFESHLYQERAQHSEASGIIVAQNGPASNCIGYYTLQLVLCTSNV